MPILLIHGFASNAVVNWLNTGWIKTLTDAGMQIIAFDNRGHGNSEKLYSSASYTPQLMAQDALNLLDHLKIGQASVMGYSMGARIAAYTALLAPQRIRGLIFGGLAYNMVLGLQGANEIAAALLAENISDIAKGQARAFRLFADATKSDRRALAACISASRIAIAAEEMARISCPVLVVAGALDDLAGSVSGLTSLIAQSKGVVLANRNHMNAVGDLGYKSAVLDFLASIPE